MSLITTPIAPVRTEEAVDLRYQLGWDGDLASLDALGLAWDASFASGCTEAQALAALSVDSDDLLVTMADAVTAGADGDFSARWWLSGGSLLLPGICWSWRMQVADVGSSASGPYGYLGLVLYHCDSDGVPAVSPLTGHSSSESGTLIRSYTGSATQVGRRVFGASWSYALTAVFCRADNVLGRDSETGARDGQTVKMHASSYTTTTTTQTQLDSRNEGQLWPSASRFRLALVLDHDGTSTQQITARIPRFQASGLKAA